MLLVIWLPLLLQLLPVGPRLLLMLLLRCPFTFTSASSTSFRFFIFLMLLILLMLLLLQSLLQSLLLLQAYASRAYEAQSLR